MNATDKSLAQLFESVGDVLRQRQAELNAADPYNGNHGDHMVQIFTVAAKAAASPDAKLDAGRLAGELENAARLLSQQAGNGSAQVYAQGLQSFASQLRRYDIALDELLAYVRKVLAEENGPTTSADVPARSGDVLKALVAGLAAWSESDNGHPEKGSPLNMGALFELGIAYMQAKQHGGSRLEVLANAAASASPLSKLPHRYQSGKLAIQAFLEAIRQSG